MENNCTINNVDFEFDSDNDNSSHKPIDSNLFVSINNVNLVETISNNSNFSHNPNDSESIDSDLLKMTSGVEIRRIYHGLKFFDKEYMNIWFLIMVFVFTIGFIDLIYVYKNEICIDEPAGKLLINLKDYLLVSGWIEMSILCIIYIGLSIANTKIITSDRGFDCSNKLIMIAYKLLSSFIPIWNIIGAMIFWNLMDTSDCTNRFYYYVYVSLIIKLILSAFVEFRKL